MSTLGPTTRFARSSRRNRQPASTASELRQFGRQLGRLAHQVWRSLATLWHLCDAERHDLGSHILALLELVQLPVHVELKVDDLIRRQGNDDLTAVGCRRHNRLLVLDAPLVHLTIGEDVANATRVNLEKGVVAELLHAEGWR